MPYVPNYNADPTDADLAQLLTAAGVYTTQVAAFNLGFAAGSVTRFEKATGRIPFLAQASTSLLFDPPGTGSQMPYNMWAGGSKVLELMPCFTTITGVAMAVTVDSPTGSPLDIQRQMYFHPYNHAELGVPIEWIEFLIPIYGLRQSLQVTGTPGNYAAWPADAWNAVLMGAAADLSAIIGLSISGGISEQKELDVSERYEPNPLKAFEDSWRARFNTVVSAYKLLVVGLG